MGTKRPTRSAMDDAKTILNRIRQLVRVLRAFDKEAQARYGIGAAQMFILHVLAHEQDLSLNEVADRTATDQSSVSLAVGRLVEERYVSRTVDPEDRRQVRLALTAKGRTLVRRSPPAAQERMMESVQQMAAADRSRLIALLDAFMAGMGVEDGKPPMLFQDEPEKKPRRRKPQ